MSFEEVLVVLLIPMPVLDAIATVFFLRLFLRSEHSVAEPGGGSRWRSAILGSRSWLLGLLTLAFAIITIAFVIVGVLAAGRIFEFRVTGSLVMLSIALFFLGAIPPVFMWAFWQSRRRDGHPPPFMEDD